MTCSFGALGVGNALWVGAAAEVGLAVTMVAAVPVDEVFVAGVLGESSSEHAAKVRATPNAEQNRTSRVKVTSVSLLPV
ncbi:MAG: hypothetical protein IH609_04760 [Dehalococcoidia bacterium]|nr:hypothetical protein [Dehalococcoidia bacterium]